MAAPKIKMYLLPPGYVEAQDTDVQQRVNDELLPVRTKQEALDTVYALTGVRPWENLPCYPIDMETGIVSTIELVDSGGGHYVPDGYTPSTVLVGPSGELAPKIFDGSYEVGPSGYIIHRDEDGLFEYIELALEMSDPRIEFYLRGTTPTTDWALPASNPYAGTNDCITRIIVEPSGGSGWGEGDPAGELLANSILVAPSGSVIHLADEASSVMCRTLWTTASTSQWFAGDQGNWVKDHLRMNVDVFVGTKDYPGDQGEVAGTPFVQGPVPQFREFGTYAVNHRYGYVRFPEEIDSTATPVKANYAYLVGIRNVDKMKLDGNVGHTQYTPTSELIWTGAHGKPVVTRNDQVMPFNVYVNGDLVGRPVSKTPFDVLSVKLA